MVSQYSISQTLCTRNTWHGHLKLCQYLILQSNVFSSILFQLWCALRKHLCNLTLFWLKQIYWYCCSFNSYFLDTCKFRVKIFIICGECLLPGIRTISITQNNSWNTPQGCLVFFLCLLLMIFPSTNSGSSKEAWGLSSGSEGFWKQYASSSGSGRSLPGKKDLGMTRITFSTTEEKQLGDSLCYQFLLYMVQEATAIENNKSCDL